MRRVQLPSPAGTGAGRRMQGVLLAALVAVVGALLQPIPVATQALVVEAPRVDEAVAGDDPWAPIWERVPRQEVPLSAQNIAAPFGGGTVQALTVRAVNDGETLYLAVEWADDEADDTVGGVSAFSDAVALQFAGGTATSLPPFTMGAPGSMVNIWQWKAVWQTDQDTQYLAIRDRYPNTYVDFYPNASDERYQTARAVGNPLAQPERASPIENLVAEGFGTLTHADSQDVAGVGAWKDGRWRVVFARPFTPEDPSGAVFRTGELTNVAFAVWDGAEGDRNGQKSIAQFVQLSIGDESTSIPDASERVRGGDLWLPVSVAAVALVLMVGYLVMTRPAGRL